MIAFPSVYLVRKSRAKTKLYLGEYSSGQGLALFSPSLSVSVNAAFFDSSLDRNRERQRSLLASKTVAEVVINLGADGPFDFSCEIEEDVQFSSHDDGECHILLPSISCAKKLILGAAPAEFGEAIWKKMVDNPNCYVSNPDSQTNEIAVFESFESYLNSSKAE